MQQLPTPHHHLFQLQHHHLLHLYQPQQQEQHQDLITTHNFPIMAMGLMALGLGFLLTTTLCITTTISLTTTFMETRITLFVEAIIEEIEQNKVNKDIQFSIKLQGSKMKLNKTTTGK